MDLSTEQSISPSSSTCKIQEAPLPQSATATSHRPFLPLRVSPRSTVQVPQLTQRSSPSLRSADLPQHLDPVQHRASNNRHGTQQGTGQPKPAAASTENTAAVRRTVNDKAKVRRFMKQNVRRRNLQASWHRLLNASSDRRAEFEVFCLKRSELNRDIRQLEERIQRLMRECYETTDRAEGKELVRAIKALEKDVADLQVAQVKVDEVMLEGMQREVATDMDMGAFLTLLPNEAVSDDHMHRLSELLTESSLVSGEKQPPRKRRRVERQEDDAMEIDHE